MAKVLVIEDDVLFGEMTEQLLRKEGHEVVLVRSGREGLEQLQSFAPDAVILDLGLPDGSGFDFCKSIRAVSDVPILVVSGRSDEMDKVLALELGADDYTTKPFAPRELMARLRAAMRRAGSVATTPIEVDIGPYRVDGRRFEVTMNGEIIDALTAREVELLLYLTRHAGRAVDREELFREVWGQEGLGRSRTVDAHVSSLRSKLPELPLTTVRGKGYRLDMEI